MIEILLAVIGLVGGFLIALGWYRRGLLEMEKELASVKERLSNMEKEGQATHTDIALIKQRIGFMESKIDDMHRVIMRTHNNTSDE